MLVVADGLGGHNAGEIASTIATRAMPTRYFAKTGKNRFLNFKEAFAETNREVFDAAQESESLKGMCTTLVAALVVNRHLIFAHVGDSRGYLFREGLLLYRTRDHALQSNLFDTNGNEPRRESSHILTQAIGSHPSVRPSYAIHRIHNGDVFLLCSDGLTGVVPDDQILECLAPGTVQEAAEQLMMRAKADGSQDNVSIVLSRVIDVGPQESLPISINDLDYYIAPSQ